MSKRTLSLIGFLIIITAILLIIALSPKTTSPTPTVTASPTPSTSPKVVGNTTISLYPNPLVTSSNSASLDVLIDSGGDKVTAVQVEISYDPTVLTLKSIDQGAFLNNAFVLLKNIDAKNGRLSYALAINPNAAPVTGAGRVATLNFAVNTQSTTKNSQITLLPKSLVTAQGIYESVLVKSTGTIVKISTP